MLLCLTGQPDGWLSSSCLTGQTDADGSTAIDFDDEVPMIVTRIYELLPDNHCRLLSQWVPVFELTKLYKM